jgi:hypothetical protein
MVGSRKVWRQTTREAALEASNHEPMGK